MITPLVLFSAALVTSAALTVLVRMVAPRVGLTDRPDGRRKLHTQNTPLGGGIAVFCATAGVLGVWLVLPAPWGLQGFAKWSEVFALMAACTCVVALGAVDDRFGIRGRYKLLGQLAAACILVSSGLVIERLQVFGHPIGLGILAVPFTLFWLVGATNAINLLDGLDGLASTLGIILSLAMCVIAVITGHPVIAIVALVFAGALLGFLPFNFPPASIFLGDSGSMLIGLMLGALAITGSMKAAGTFLLAAPLAVWTIPVFDSMAAIIRRKLTGRSIFATDRAHLHHRMLDKLGSNRKVLAWVAVASSLTSIGALASLLLRSELIALISCSAVVLAFVITGVFGRTELSLLVNRVRGVGLPFARPRGSGRARQTIIRTQGSRQWETLWETLTESAERLRLYKIFLDVDVPATHDGFHATWTQGHEEDMARCWQMEFPLTLAEHSLGRLVVVGRRNGSSMRPEFEQVWELIDPLEKELGDLLELDDLKAPFGRTVPVADGPGNGSAATTSGKGGLAPSTNWPELQEE